MIEERKEDPSSMAVCDQGKYLFLALGRRYSFSSSRLMVFEVKGHSVTTLLILDEFHHSVLSKRCLSFFRQLGNYLLWVQLSQFSVHLYCFNSESGELQELVEKRVMHGEEFPDHIEKVGEDYYFIGMKAKIIKLTIGV